MSVIAVILRKLLSGILYVLNFVKRVFRFFCRQKESNIGELPRFAEPKSILIHQDGSQPQNSWSSWNDTSFGVEFKIEEYRRKQAEAQNNANNASVEPDYFSDLRPEIKAAKRLSISPVQPRQNLFEFIEDAVNIRKPPTELGDLDFDVTVNPATNDNAWGNADLDVDQLDRVLHEQKQRERQERQKLRLEEHQRRQAEKQLHRKPV